ncbi:MAG: M28 family metallopeptidase [Bacteroides sp.]|nr:M28 family metallopeptidase [Bacteroides sp.]
MKDTEGEKLLPCAGHPVELSSRALRIPETAFNVTAKNNPQTKNRIVITAHIDTKIGTPGAIDNATGVTIVLLLAELLKDHPPKHPIELVILNGEDYYGAPGQVKYREQNQDKFSEILLNINIDGVGYKEGPSCFSPFNIPATTLETLYNVCRNTPGIVEGVPWYQGDHSLFLQNHCLTIAVSSQWFIENMECQTLTHTPQDNLGVVSYEQVAQCALGIAELIRML